MSDRRSITSRKNLGTYIRDRIHPTQDTRTISVKLTDETVAVMDQVRGKESRSAFVRQAIIEYLARD